VTARAPAAVALGAGLLAVPPAERELPASGSEALVVALTGAALLAAGLAARTRLG
jgi:hypothetical protein